MMTRRNFLKSLVLVPVVVAAGKVGFTMESEPSLAGVSYHFNDGTTGTWLGINRNTVPMWKPYPMQVKFFNHPIDSRMLMYAGRRIR